MILILNLSSSLGQFAIFDESKGNEWTYLKWSKAKSLNLELKVKLQEILDLKKTTLQELKSIYCVEGPGSFTGLRVSASFCTGLSLALKIPFYGIPSFFLNNENEFFLPLQFERAKTLSLAEALEKKLSFIKIASQEECLISTPKITEENKVFAINNQEWPSEVHLKKAFLLSAQKPRNFQLNYGLEAYSNN